MRVGLSPFGLNGSPNIDNRQTNFRYWAIRLRKTGQPSGCPGLALPARARNILKLMARVSFQVLKQVIPNSCKPLHSQRLIAVAENYFRLVHTEWSWKSGPPRDARQFSVPVRILYRSGLA
jgi:hypothetical protein